MAITKAEIFTTVLRRLGPAGGAVSNIDEELRSTLYDISGRDDFLMTSAAFVTVDGVANYVAETVAPLHRNIHNLFMTDHSRLDLGSYQDYLDEISEQTTPTTGEPGNYCLENNNFYLWPVPDAVYTVTVTYAKYHANSVTTIEFGESFREAIYNGTLMKLWAGQLAALPQASAELQKCLSLYEAEIAKRRNDLVRQPILVRYRDI